MKILHITTIDTGGAFKAVDRLNECLKKTGFDSAVLLRTKNEATSDAYEYLNCRRRKIASKIKNGINLLLKKGEVERDLFGSNISNLDMVKEADIICIHWINSFLSYKGIEQLLKTDKRIVFFMHDMWLFTGGCHVDKGCGKYEKGCGNCDLINSTDLKDITWKNHNDKKNLFSKYSFRVCGPSKWITDCAKRSDVLCSKQIDCLPNCYDDNIFNCFLSRKKVREELGIKTEKTVLLFGAAHDGTANKNKGFDYLIEALKHLDKDKYYLLIFGNAKEEQFVNIGFEYKLLGYVSGDTNLARVYSAADLYVTPSLQESFGYTVCESMACATPVVAFPVGGILDQITHKENGYLAKLKDAEDLAKGIDYVRENKTMLGERASVTAKRFSYETLGKRYKEFFEKLNME